MVDKIYYIVLIGSFVFFILTFFIIYLAIFQVRKKNVYRQELSRVQLEIKEQTLKHIGYELHDNLGQVASLIKINLNTLQLENQQQATQKVEDTKDLVRQLITDLKSLSLSLNSDRVVQMGLVKCMEREVDRLNRIGQFEPIQLELEGRVPTLDDNTTIILYRMIQEVLNNTVKHSGAKRIAISIKVTENLFTLAIVDDGVGFSIEEKSGSGSGLLNLQNRAKLVQAKFSMQSSIGNGTQTRIELSL